MRDIWIVVIAVGVATIAIKGIGPAILGGRPMPARAAGVVELLAPAVLAALVVTQIVGGDHRLVLDAKIVGFAVAVLLLWRKAPMLVVLVSAAAATALWRAFL